MTLEIKKILLEEGIGRAIVPLMAGTVGALATGYLSDTPQAVNDYQTTADKIEPIQNDLNNTYNTVLQKDNMSLEDSKYYVDQIRNQERSLDAVAGEQAGNIETLGKKAALIGAGGLTTGLTASMLMRRRR